MHLSFFNAKEVSSIIISSDGVMLNQNFLSLMNVQGNANNRSFIFQAMKQLENLSKEEKINKLSNLVLSCSDYNETGYGTGDDCSLIFIHFK